MTSIWREREREKKMMMMMIDWSISFKQIKSYIICKFRNKSYPEKQTNIHTRITDQSLDFQIAKKKKKKYRKKIKCNHYTLGWWWWWWASLYDSSILIVGHGHSNYIKTSIDNEFHSYCRIYMKQQQQKKRLTSWWWRWRWS